MFTLFLVDWLGFVWFPVHLIIVWILRHPCSNFGHHLTCEKNQDGWDRQKSDWSNPIYFITSLQHRRTKTARTLMRREKKANISRYILFFGRRYQEAEKNMFQNLKGRAFRINISMTLKFTGSSCGGILQKLPNNISSSLGVSWSFFLLSKRCRFAGHGLKI